MEHRTPVDDDDATVLAALELLDDTALDEAAVLDVAELLDATVVPPPTPALDDTAAPPLP
jgi:hypothetical protein